MAFQSFLCVVPVTIEIANGDFFKALFTAAWITLPLLKLAGTRDRKLPEQEDTIWVSPPPPPPIFCRHYPTKYSVYGGAIVTRDARSSFPTFLWFTCPLSDLFSLVAHIFMPNFPSTRDTCALKTTRTLSDDPVPGG